MKTRKLPGLDFDDRDVREEILIRQRRDIWTPEQIASLSKHFRLEPGMSFLDAGCGFAYSLRTFGPACMPGGRLIGVDREEALLETAARLAEEAGLGTAATFQAGDIHDLHFEDDTFDVVMAQVVLCHLAEPQRALDEMIRVAKRGGCIGVFDNAIGGCPWGWDITFDPPIKKMVRRCRQLLLSQAGRKKLGRGDWSVGLLVPGWMEARGLHDVDARVNERVRWIAPPYRSPAQQTALQQARERHEDDGFAKMVFRNMADELRAVGADERTTRRAVRSARKDEKRFRRAAREGTASFAHGGTFWCIWGFKP